MSEGCSNEAGTARCASCGVAENDEIKLKKCNGCYLVRYCGFECQKVHRKQHKRDCKKRAAELREELLFKQPESSHHGDCPICCLPLPLDLTKSGLNFCCSKVICRGCDYANLMREMELRVRRSCPFCREPMLKANQEGAIQNMKMKRVEANDPVALCQEGSHHQSKGDYIRAFEYYTKAAELGDVNAHYNLAVLYHNGEGVKKNGGKEIHHLEEAAIGGHPHARRLLGCKEYLDNRNIERAVKHWIIAATQGEDESIQELMKAFKNGFVGKDVLAAALRAHKAAVDATKSPQREAAEKLLKNSRK